MPAPQRQPAAVPPPLPTALHRPHYHLCSAPSTAASMSTLSSRPRAGASRATPSPRSPSAMVGAGCSLLGRRCWVPCGWMQGLPAHCCASGRVGPGGGGALLPLNTLRSISPHSGKYSPPSPPAAAAAPPPPPPRHAGKFYTLVTGSNERRWRKMADQVRAVVNSFEVDDRF